MHTWISILASLAAAAAFYVLDIFVLQLDFWWQMISVGAIFIASLSLALIIQWRAGENRNAAGVMSDNEVAKGMTGKINELDAPNSKERVLSGNKVGGDANFEIKNTKL